VITRQVTRILSPGTLVDDIYIDDERAIYLLAVKEHWEASGAEPPAYGVCFVDTATGEVNLGYFQDDRDRTQFETLLLQIKPREILYEKEGPHSLCSPQTLQLVHIHRTLYLRVATNLGPFATPPPLHTTRDVQIKRNVNQPTLTRRRPGEQFWNASTTADFLAGAGYFNEGKEGEEGWPPALRQLTKEHREGKEGCELCLSALGGVVSYLKELYLDKEVFSQGRISTYSGTTFDSPNLVLDSKTIKNLELFENTVDGKVHTPASMFVYD
jgi:DNA mismatch repair protein MSH6